MAFLEKAQLDDSAKSKLVDAILEVMSEKGVNVHSFSIIAGSPHDKYLNMYDITLDTANVDLLADANMDLAYKLAKHDELLGKNFSVWLSGRGDI